MLAKANVNNKLCELKPAVFNKEPIKAKTIPFDKAIYMSLKKLSNVGIKAKTLEYSSSFPLSPIIKMKNIPIK